MNQTFNSICQKQMFDRNNLKLAQPTEGFSFDLHSSQTVSLIYLFYVATCFFFTLN